jgi:hypothetical protein
MRLTIENNEVLRPRNVGLQLQLLRVYLPGYFMTFAGSANGFTYAFVRGYLSGTMVIALYHAERGL